MSLHDRDRRDVAGDTGSGAHPDGLARRLRESWSFSRWGPGAGTVRPMAAYDICPKDVGAFLGHPDVAQGRSHCGRQPGVRQDYSAEGASSVA